MPKSKSDLKQLLAGVVSYDGGNHPGRAQGDLVDGVAGYRYQDFESGYLGNLTDTPVAITDTEADNAAATPNAANILLATAATNAVNTYASDGGAAGALFLPEATVDAHLAVEITDNIDGSTGTFTINTSGSANVTSTNVFAKQIVRVETNTSASLGLHHASASLGTAAAPTSKKIVYTPATSKNVLGKGSIIHFYAPVTGQWLVKIFNVPQGNGTNGDFTTTT